MIKIGKTGLYFDGGNKGHLTIYYQDHGKKLRAICDNLDCTHELFRILLNVLNNGGFGINEGLLFLKAHENAIKYAFEQQVKSHKHMSKCYNCGANIFKDIKNPGTDLCPPMGIDADCIMEKITYSLPDIDKHVNPKDLPITHIKDFDLRWNGVWGVHLECIIKSIKNPKVKDGHYTQRCVLYDKDTSKTINAKLTDSVAEFDKWYAGNKVKIIGEYANGILHVIYMEHIEEDSDVKLSVSRVEEHPDYPEWRETIIKRDNQCVCCGLDKHLEAHHLFGYKENPELATNEHNGVTLCKFCHDKYHSVYGLKNINPVDFMNFIKKYGVR